MLDLPANETSHFNEMKKVFIEAKLELNVWMIVYKI